MWITKELGDDAGEQDGDRRDHRLTAGVRKTVRMQLQDGRVQRLDLELALDSGMARRLQATQGGSAVHRLSPAATARP